MNNNATGSQRYSKLFYTFVYFKDFEIIISSNKRYKIVKKNNIKALVQIRNE